MHACCSITKGLVPRKWPKHDRNPQRGDTTDLVPTATENHGCQPTVWEVGHPKMELGKPSTVGFVSMVEMSRTAGNDAIVEVTKEIHDLPQRILVVPLSLEAFWGHLCTIFSSARTKMPLHALVVPF